MAGLLHSSLKPTVSCSTTSSPSSSRLILFLKLLLLSLACFAFVLQWYSGLNDTHWSMDHPGMATIQEKPSYCPSGSDSFPYYRDWKFDHHSDLQPRICITATTSAGLEQTLPWIFFHKVIGVSTFYLFVEGKAASPNVSRVLETIPGVKVIHRTKELEDQQAKSRIWNETWLSSFFYKPCNYELFVKQNFNMETAITMAKDDGMDWIVHIDTDELIHPSGTPEYSLRNLLGNVSADVDAVIFPNHESSVERDNVKEPFTEVTLFKKNDKHLLREVFFEIYQEAARGNPNYFLTYGNGKSAARVQDHLRPNGAHRWDNYEKIINEFQLQEAVVLHYTYSRFSDLTSRHDRCNCKPNKVDVKRCFMLEFDRDAFIIASTANSEEMLQWYRERVVWTDEELKLKLLKKGILTRIYAPMIIIQGLREAGVFSSVVNAALTNNSSTVADSTLNMTREPSQETSRRRVLEFHIDGRDGESQALAVSPQSPPSWEAIQMDSQSKILQRVRF